MSLVRLIFNVTAIVLTLTFIALVTLVGLERIKEFRPNVIDRLRLAFPYVLLLGAVLLVNDFLRAVGPELSWIFGWEITRLIIAIEGDLVTQIQSFAHPLLTRYFSYIYIYGYIFLLTFPVIAYFFLTDDRPIKEVTLAYTLNYGFGVILYMLFIALGPRNTGHAEPLLYTHWPESQLLTTEVNANVNVFPSLHTSLSATVAYLAIRWREAYQYWLPVAMGLAISVMISTMYLGIHWATDVVAGIILAIVCVKLSIWLSSPNRMEGLLGKLGHNLRQIVDIPFDYVVSLLIPVYHRCRAAISTRRIE